MAQELIDRMIACGYSVSDAEEIVADMLETCGYIRADEYVREVECDLAINRL